MENIQLTLADLASAKNIIEAATSRGAFKADELSQVGAVYDKLSAFLTQTQAQQDAEKAAQQAAAEQTQGEA
jgi:hypothetical protein